MTTAPNWLSGTGGTYTDIDQAIEVFRGEVAEEFRVQPMLYGQSTVPIIDYQTVQGVGTYKWDLFGETPRAQEMQSGDEIAGQNFAFSEGSNYADNYIVASHFVRWDTLRQSHYNPIPRLAKSLSRQVYLEADRRIINRMCYAGRSTTAVTKDGLTIHHGSNRVTRTGGAITTSYASSAIGAQNLKADHLRQMRNLDESDIPDDGRYCIMRTELREVLSFDSSVITTYGTPSSANLAVGTSPLSQMQEQGGNDQFHRTFRDYHGAKIIGFAKGLSHTKGGLLPDRNINATADVDADYGFPSRYQVDFSIGASSGAPAVVYAAAAPDGMKAVTVGTWEAPYATMVPDERRKGVWMICSLLMGAAVQYAPAAGVIEIIT